MRPDTANARRRRVVAVGLVVLMLVTLGAGAPASALSDGRCPDRTTSVFDGSVPSDNGGYIFDDGEFRTFTLPGAVGGGPSDINDRGDMVGPYTDAAGVQHGFRVDRRGCLVVVDHPGPPRSKNEALGINDRGHIVGVYGNYGDETTGESHAYSRGRRGFSSYDVPGALATAAVKNNDRGQIVGVYSNESRDRVGTADAHGYLYDHGELTPIDAPGAVHTFLFDINDRGQILGVGTDAYNAAGFGFIRDRRGGYTRLPDTPGALTTLPLGFNNRGQIVGIYWTATGQNTATCSTEGGSPPSKCPGRRSPTRSASTTAVRSSGPSAPSRVPAAPSPMEAAIP